MLDQNERAVIGDNNPPDPIDEAVAPFSDEISEAENWADGQLVENEKQLEAIDKILPVLRTAKAKIDAARLEATKPMRDAVAAENLRWKVTIDDVDRLKNCLVDASSDYRENLAEQKRAAEQAAYEKAEQARKEAEAKEQAARAGDIEAQREADAAKQRVIEAEKDAKVASKDKPKNMRTVWRYDAGYDRKATLHWIAKHRRDDMTAFIEQYVEKHHRDIPDDIVASSSRKEAY